MADRAIDDSEWAPHLNLIAELYVGKHRSYEQIAKALEPFGLIVSGFTVKARLAKWRISRLSYEDELRLMAKHLLHQRQRGQRVTFTRWGVMFSSSEIEDFLRRNPETPPSEELLPEYLKAVVTTPHDVDRNGDQQSSVQDGNGLVTGLPPVRDTLNGRQQDTEKQRKRQKQTIVASRTRPVKASTSQRPKRPRDETPTQRDNDDSDEDPDETSSSKPVGSQVQAIEDTVEKIRSLSHHMGLSYEDITKHLLDPEKLRKIANKPKKEEGEEDTDLGPLHRAALKNNTRILEALLKKGAKINAVGGARFTALHAAAFRGNFQALKVLALHPEVDLNALDQRRNTALNLAIGASSLPCALLLVNKGANVDLRTIAGMTPLHIACIEKNMQELVLQLLAKSNQINHQDEDGLTALHVALACKNWDYVMPLINGGANLNLQDKDGRTAMHQACFNAPAELLMEMIHKDVDFTKCGNEGETILHLLCQRDLCEVTEIVVKKEGVDINAKTFNGSSPLILAVCNNSDKTVRMLVEQNADVGVVDVELDTALTAAIRKGNDEIAEFLIDHGSPIDPQNQSPTRYKARLEHNRKAEEVYSLLASVAKSSTHPARSQTGIRTQEPSKTPTLRGPNFYPGEPYGNMTNSQAIDNLMDQGTFLRGSMPGTVGGNFGTGGLQPGPGGNFPNGFVNTSTPINYPPFPNNNNNWEFNPALYGYNNAASYMRDMMLE